MSAKFKERFGFKEEDGDPVPNESGGMIVDFLRKNIGDSNFSWGLLLLLVVAVYAIYNLVVVFLRFFG